MHQHYVNWCFLDIVADKFENPQNLYDQAFRFFREVICEFLDLFQVWMSLIFPYWFHNQSMVVSGKKQLSALTAIHVRLFFHDFNVLFYIKRHNDSPELMSRKYRWKNFRAKWSYWVIKTDQSTQLFLDKKTFSWTYSPLNVVLHDFLVHCECVAFDVSQSWKLPLTVLDFLLYKGHCNSFEKRKDLRAFERLKQTSKPWLVLFWVFFRAAFKIRNLRVFMILFLFLRFYS